MSVKKKQGGGRPRKGKENQSPIASSNQGPDTMSTASGGNDQAAAAEENRILREKLAATQGKYSVYYRDVIRAERATWRLTHS